MNVDKFRAILAGYIPVSVLQAVIIVAALAYFSRVLTPAEYGRYTIALVVIQMAQSGLFYWLHAGFARLYAAASKQGDVSEHLSAGYLGFLGVAILVLALGLLPIAMAPTAMERYRELTIAGVIALITRSLLMMGLETHRAAGHVRRYTLLEGGQQLLTFALSIAFIAVRGPAAEAPIWGLAIANLVCVLIDAPNMIRMTGRFNPRRAQLRALAQYGMPLTLSLFLGVVIASSDRIFIAWLMDESAVGIYSAAYSLADRPLSMLFNWVAMAATPIAFSAMEHEGAPGAQRVLEKTAKTLILVVLPAAAGLAVVAEPMAAVLIGKQFRAGAVSLVPPLALAGLLHGAMVHYAEHAYLITRRTKTLLVVTLIAALVNILLNVILIPIMGLYGAVVATIIAYAVGFACSMLVGRSVLAVPMPLVTLTKGVLACALMASAILMIHLPNGISGLLLGICLGAAVYALAAWVLDLADVRVRATQWATRRAVRRNGVG